MRKLLLVLSLTALGCPNSPGPGPGSDGGATDMTADAADGSDAKNNVEPDVRPGDMPGDMGDGGPLLGRRTPVPVQAGVSDDGAADVTTALDSEARAGRITTADTGFRGLWSHCKQGDFKLYNDRIEACISNEISTRYETFAGGGLLDVRVVGQQRDDVFDLYNAKIGFNVAHPETVRVVRDGSDDGPAVIRLEGTDMPAAYFVGVAGANLFRANNLDVVVEYRLAPNEDFIEILTFVTNSNATPVMVTKGDLIAWGDRVDTYRQGSGFTTNTGEFQWIAAHGPGYAFAYVTPDDIMRSLSASFGEPPWEITEAEAFVLQPDESFAHFGRMFIGEALDDVLRGAQEELDGSPPMQRTLLVVDGDQNPLAGRRVEVLDGETSISGGLTDDTGRVTVSMPDTASRVVVSGVVGGGGVDATYTAGSDAEIEVVAPTPGRVEFTVTADGMPSPAYVLATSVLGNYEGATWRDLNSGLDVMPGEWTFTFGRGPEYDYVQQNVTVTAGQTTDVSVALTQLMDTSNWVAADFHQHMEPSSDSRVLLEDRVLDNAGQGVEFVVPTDHDVVTDLVPVIAEAGLDGIMATLPGAEVSPAVAHTNVYPLPYEKDAPGRGTLPLAVLDNGAPDRLTVPELVAIARSLPSDPVVQINHPRDSSGLFDFVGFDPEVGPDAVSHNWFTTDFDAMEVTNGDDCQQFKDWSGLWNAGVAPTPIGSSDSHGAWGDVGSQRTYLYAPNTTVSALGSDEVRDIVKAGQVVVGTSVLIDFTDGIVPGDTLDASAGTVDLAVRIQSANWVGVDELSVIVNGVRTQVIAVTPVDATLDYQGTITVPVTGDSWVSFLASGAATSNFTPSSKRPYAFTGAVMLDADGNGFVAPGVGALDLDALPICN